MKIFSRIFSEFSTFQNAFLVISKCSWSDQIAQILLYFSFASEIGYFFRLFFAFFFSAAQKSENIRLISHLETALSSLKVKYFQNFSFSTILAQKSVQTWLGKCITVALRMHTQKIKRVTSDQQRGECVWKSWLSLGCPKKWFWKGFYGFNRKVYES